MADKATAIKAPEATATASNNTAAEAAAEKKGRGRPRAPVVDPNLKIHLLATTNPKRQGSKTFVRFACYKDGMSVGQFCDAVEKAGQTKGLAVADVRYDAAHKHIELRA